MTHSTSTSAVACLGAAVLSLGVAVTATAAQPVGDPTRGAYLATIMDCQGCHSGRLPDGRIDPAAHLTGGSLGFELPGLGIFYPPNLTPDAATGLGAWSEAEVTTAIREGIRPDGRILAPIMPWESYRVLTDGDVADLVAYLRSLPPAHHAVPPPAGDGTMAEAPYFAMVVPASAP
jgi:mono/diheme cytochrome c family protein